MFAAHNMQRCFLLTRCGAQYVLAHVQLHRTVAKALLNSLWGKHCQNLDKEQTDYFTTGRSFGMFLREPSREIIDIYTMGEIAMVTHKTFKEHRRPHAFYNPVVGLAFSHCFEVAVHVLQSVFLS